MAAWKQLYFDSSVNVRILVGKYTPESGLFNYKLI
jgi:hypothetical protein